MIRVLYAGSPAASAKTLEILIENAASNGFRIAGVLSNPPSARGRHKTPVPTEVQSVAEKYGIPVFTPEHLDSAAREAVAAVSPDILVCFAYGHIFGPKFMELFKFGGINLHPSALPKYRGCTPVNAAILNGDSETAFTVQKVSRAMDEGNIMASEKVVLTGKETAESLLNDAAVRGAALLAEVLKAVADKGAIADGTPQSGEASYTGMILKEHAKINWAESAEKVDCAVRAYYPEPNAWTQEDGAPLKIMAGIPLSDQEGTECGGDVNAAAGVVSAFSKQKGILVRCGIGFYAVTKLQRQGKNAMDYKSFMNGAKDFIGSRFSF